jgi:hypothetical protein
MGFIRKPMGEGLVCDRIAGQKVKSVIGPPGPPMTVGKLRREKGGSIAPVPGAHASYKRGPGCLWARGGSALHSRRTTAYA